ncbi:MAG: HAD family hydrolase [bacterium]|nr:HAD family hydrolase [bacterium]
MSLPPFHAWLFDLDGTLVDSMKGVVDCMKVTAKEVGGEVTNETELRASFGRGLMNTLVPWIPEGKLDEALERYEENFPKYVKTQISLVSGAKELLDWVKARELPIGVVTGNKIYEAQGLFDATGLHEYFNFDHVVCADSIPFQKPSPEPVLECCRRLGVEPSDQVVFVGDSEHDIRAGKLAGVRTIAVLGGSSPKERLLAAEPDFVFESLEEVFRQISC